MCVLAILLCAVHRCDVASGRLDVGRLSRQATFTKSNMVRVGGVRIVGGGGTLGRLLTFRETGHWAHYWGGALHCGGRLGSRL